ncbi:MAG: metal-dependent transcriptional regulator [Anaerolineae bacterium]|nr:metal-dependent transcriptional regulator [Anaerolineae bacterium]
MAEKTDLRQSRSVQDFLKAVYGLQQVHERVSTNALAEGLEVQAPSITDMAQRLVAAGLVDYERYKGVRLTASGEALALKIIRRHRLIELYLVEELGYALQDVHDEAEHLEHAVSDRFIEAIATKLGDPDFDPHGDPIPAPDGTMTERDLLAVTVFPLGILAQVARIAPEGDDMLQHILDKGFHLGARIMITQREPFEGPITLSLDGKSIFIGHQVAACVLVEALEPADAVLPLEG